MQVIHGCVNCVNRLLEHGSSLVHALNKNSQLAKDVCIDDCSHKDTYRCKCCLKSSPWANIVASKQESCSMEAMEVLISGC